MSKLRLDPRTKLIIWLFVNVIVFAVTARIFSVLAMAFYAVLFFLSGKFSDVTKLAAVYFAMILLQKFALPHFPAAFAAVFAAVGYAVLIFPCAAGGSYIVSTTSVGEFTAAMRKMKLPESLIIALAVTLRYLPSLRQDIRHITEAMSLRKIHGIMQKTECIYVPILMGTVQTAQELSDSALARGIENPNTKTSWSQIGFHLRDFAVIGAFFCLCAAAIAFKAVGM